MPRSTTGGANGRRGVRRMARASADVRLERIAYELCVRSMDVDDERESRLMRIADLCYRAAARLRRLDR